MKKSLLVVGLMSMMLFPVFAEYTLKADDQKMVDAVIQKIQAKPIHTQEVVIKALKSAQTKTNFTEQKQAIFAAVESGLRQKNSNGKLLATSLERKEIATSVFAKKVDEKMGSATLHIAGDLTSTTEPKKVVFDTTLGIDADMRDNQNPKVAFRVEGSASADEEKFAGAGEVRVIDKQGFFLLKSLSLVPDESDLAGLVSPYLNIWWKMPLDPVSLQDVQTQTELQTQKREEVKKILFKNNIIPSLIYEGQTKGVSTYNGTIDNNALVTTLADIATSQGTEVTASDIQDMKKQLQWVTLQTRFSLDANNLLTGVTLTALANTITLPDDSQLSGTVTVEVISSPLTQAIIAPNSAKDFDTLFSTGL